ncbi:MAG: hypothetical protein ABL897_15150, partial [Hyphomicrobium sp.]
LEAELDGRAILSAAGREAAIAAERERCAEIAERRVNAPPECEHVGPMDWETGARECQRRHDCLCDERTEEAAEIAAAIRRGEE